MCITKTYIRLIISIILVVFTCQCEEDNYPARERVSVYAGMYDTGFVYQEFEPALQVALKLDTSNNCYYGYDSVDIDTDGEYDFFIEEKVKKEKLDSGKSGLDFYNSHYEIKLGNYFEVVFKKEDLPIGPGMYARISWVDTISYNTRIDAISYWDWRKIQNFPISMWRDSTITCTGSYFSNSCWYDVDEEIKYIAIRRKSGYDYKYGWIKVNAASRYQLAYMSFAFER